MSTPLLIDPLHAPECVSCRKTLTDWNDVWQVTITLRSGGARRLSPLCYDCYRQYPQPDEGHGI